MTMDQPRFLADGMLGRLSQWLRILGVDCLFFRDAPDAELRRRALAENRILLTRDRALADAMPPLLRFFVPHQRYPDQVRDLLRAFPALDRPDRLFTRCVVCNGLLAEIPAAEATDVPDRARAENDRFWRCRDCGKAYWRGSHYDAARAFLEKMRAGAMGPTRF